MLESNKLLKLMGVVVWHQLFISSVQRLFHRLSIRLIYGLRPTAFVQMYNLYLPFDSNLWE